MRIGVDIGIFSVNVVIIIDVGSLPSTNKTFKQRRTKTSVFPEPRPVIIRHGPSPFPIIDCCFFLSFTFLSGISFIPV
jgi:hypothetical protein